MLEVKSKRQGWAGYASIIGVNSTGMFNIVYGSAEAVMDKEFLNSLKSQQSLFNAKYERI